MAKPVDAPCGARFVSDGRVNCPVRRGDAEIEDCLRCRWLRDLDPHEPSRFVTCVTPLERTPLLTTDL